MKITANLPLFLSFFLLFQSANAFNITQILLKYPDFSSFNTYLTNANLAGIINSRETITVLVVQNGNLSPISGKSPQVLANIMSVHVLLDYFDVPKLQHLPNGPVMITTLFQTFGTPRGRQGFINVTHPSTGTVAFGSAVAGSAARSNLVKSVFTEPYNISVLQVTNIVVPPGVDGTATSPAASPARSQSPAASPAPWSHTPSRAPSPRPGGSHTPSRAPSPSPGGSRTPSMSPRAPTMATPPTKSGGPPTPSVTSAPTPASALTPNADAPAAAMGPAADSSPAAKETRASDAGTTLRAGLAAVCTVLVSTLALY